MSRGDVGPGGVVAISEDGERGVEMCCVLRVAEEGGGLFADEEEVIAEGCAEGAGDDGL